MSKARARSGEMRDWDKGIRSSGDGSSSSHLVNQSVSSSLIFSGEFFPENLQSEKGQNFFPGKLQIEKITE